MLVVKPATKTQTQQYNKQGETDFDVVVIGAGIAGMMCALSAGRKKLRVALVEAQLPGGRLLREDSCIFPGFSGKGFIAAGKILEQIKAVSGIVHIQGQAVKLHALPPLYTCTLNDGHILHGRALVVAIGALPKSLLLQGFVDLTAEGYVLTGEDMQTSQPGVYAAGDIRDKTMRFLMTAAADGTVAGLCVADYLR